MSHGKRLKEERERLNFNQAEFASLVGASRKTQIRWEQDESSPGMGDLEIWANHGLDILYVITGHLKQNPYKIDNELFEYIINLLNDVAISAKKKWPSHKLASTAVKVYNFVSEEKEQPNKQKIERILKLVVNN